IRVVGTLAALELVADARTREPMGWTEVAMVAGEVRRKHGVIVRPYGHNLVLAPPLVISEEQTARAAAAVVEVCSRLGADGALTAGWRTGPARLLRLARRRAGGIVLAGRWARPSWKEHNVTTTQAPSAAELTRRAAELVPLLRKHASWAEENRRLHSEV